jgi:hypothetical protein
MNKKLHFFTANFRVFEIQIRIYPRKGFKCRFQGKCIEIIERNCYVHCVVSQSVRLDEGERSDVDGIVIGVEGVERNQQPGR